MKGLKIGTKEVFIILIAFIAVLNFLGIWISSILLFIILALNTYLLNKQKGATEENGQDNSTISPFF